MVPKHFDASFTRFRNDVFEQLKVYDLQQRQSLSELLSAWRREPMSVGRAGNGPKVSTISSFSKPSTVEEDIPVAKLASMGSSKKRTSRSEARYAEAKQVAVLMKMNKEKKLNGFEHDTTEEHLRSDGTGDVTEDQLIAADDLPVPDSQKRPSQRSHSYQLAKQVKKVKRSATSQVKQMIGNAQSEGVAKVNGFRTWARRLVRSFKFELIFALIIITNAVFIGAQVEYAAQNLGEEPPSVFFYIQSAYGFIFLLELLLRLVAEGIAFFYNSNWAWNILDVVIVVTSLFEISLGLSALTDDSSTSKTSDTGSGKLKVLRIVRIARLLRVLRVVRVVRYVRALRTLVLSVLLTLKSVLWAMVLLMLIMYIFSILFTDAIITHVSSQTLPLSDDSANLFKFFGSLHTSMHTLFRSITGGINWQDIAAALETLSWAWVYVLTIYVSFCLFAVLNVMTGVFCNSAIQGAERDQEMAIQTVLQDKAKYLQSLDQLFKSIDVDGTGYITLSEFEEHFEEEAVRALFAMLGLDSADAWSLFSALDSDGDYMLSAADFLDTALELRGPARSVDLIRLTKEFHRLSEEIRSMEVIMSRPISFPQAEDTLSCEL